MGTPDRDASCWTGCCGVALRGRDFDGAGSVLHASIVGNRGFSILGFPIRVKASFLVMLGVFYIWMGGLPGVAAVLLAFASVLLHELGHALVARRLGVGVSAIELHFFGGAARMTSVPRTARDEITIAAAGPAVSLVLGALGFGLAALFEVQVFALVGLINLGLALFNLIPAFPSDGGRILRAVLARRRGLIAATDAAVKVGRVALIALAAIGVLYGAYQVAIIAVVLWTMGTAERMAVRLRGDDRWRTGEAAQRADFSAVTPVEYIPPSVPRPPRVVFWRV
jgi:Zn-dependent protease